MRISSVFKEIGTCVCVHLLGLVAAVINSGHQEHDTAFFSNEADIVISLIN